jgi:high-affinity Fe2+/Pb2+ permease
MLRPSFDRPLSTDPLVWFGVVGGFALSVFTGLRADLSGESFVWQIFTGTLSFTYVFAGLVLSTVRHHLRRRRAGGDSASEPAVGASPSIDDR